MNKLINFEYILFLINWFEFKRTKKKQFKNYLGNFFRFSSTHFFIDSYHSRVVFLNLINFIFVVSMYLLILFYFRLIPNGRVYLYEINEKKKKRKTNPNIIDNTCCPSLLILKKIKPVHLPNEYKEKKHEIKKYVARRHDSLFNWRDSLYGHEPMRQFLKNIFIITFVISNMYWHLYA